MTGVDDRADTGACGTPEQARSKFDLGRQLTQVMSLEPSAPALQFQDCWYTWSDLSVVMMRAKELIDRAVRGPERVVGIVLRNCPEAVAALLTVVSSRDVVLSLNPIQPLSELVADVEFLRPPVIVAARQDWSKDLSEAARRAGCVGISIDAAAELVEYVQGCVQLGGGPYYKSDPGTAVVMLTSGTTGPAKRVPLSYESLEASFLGVAHYQSRDALKPSLKSSTAVVWTPLVHISGLWSILSSFVEGRKICLMERFDVPTWVARVEEHRPKTASLPPTAMRMVLDAEVPKSALASLRSVRSGTAPLDPALKSEFQSRYGIPVLVVYGATEFAGAVAGWTIRDHERFGEEKAGSIGRAHPGVTMRVVDPETGEELPPGAIGILEAKAPQLAHPGWVETTDLARMDEDGFIWIEGRADDVIIRGGFKVPTEAVSELLRKHPSVADASVVGIPDARLGSVPVAAVELSPDADRVTADDLLELLRSRLPPYQVPVKLQVVDALPRTPSLKVSRPAVAALFANAVKA